MGRRRTCSNCGLPTGFPYIQLMVNGRRTLANLCLRCAQRRRLVNVESIGRPDDRAAKGQELEDFVKHRVKFIPDRQRALARGAGKRRGGRARSS